MLDIPLVFAGLFTVILIGLAGTVLRWRQRISNVLSVLEVRVDFGRHLRAVPVVLPDRERERGRRERE